MCAKLLFDAVILIIVKLLIFECYTAADVCIQILGFPFASRGLFASGKNPIELVHIAAKRNSTKPNSVSNTSYNSRGDISSSIMYLFPFAKWFYFFFCSLPCRNFYQNTNKYSLFY